jgi:hypothetical protein
MKNKNVGFVDNFSDITETLGDETDIAGNVF